MLLLDLTVPELVVWECGMKWKEMLSFQQWPGSWTVVMQKRPTDPLLQLSLMDWCITLIKNTLAFIELAVYMKKYGWNDICTWRNNMVTHKQSSKFMHLLWYIYWGYGVTDIVFEFLKLTSKITLNNKINYHPLEFHTTQCSPPFLKPKTQRTARSKILIVE